ncbi:MAG: TldD/PmbA family protein, partial [Candidatus Micrarchaeia archaeon]
MDIIRDSIKYAKSLGFEDVIIGIEESSVSYLKIANSEVNSIVEDSDASGQVYLTQGKKIVASDVPKVDTQNMRTAIRNAKATMKLVKPKEDYNGIAEGKFKYSKAPGYDKKLEDLKGKDMADIATAAINGALTGKAETVSGMVTVEKIRFSMGTSNGLAGNYSSADIRLSLRVDGKGFSYQDVAASKYLNKLNPGKFGKETSAMLDRVSGFGKIKSGTYDIIYSPAPASNLMQNITEMALISSVETGGFLSGKLGKEIGSRNLSIYDDGVNSAYIGSSPFDEEGYPTQKTPVVERGVLKNYLHNWSTAKKYGVKSTGNAGLIDPKTNTLVLDFKSKVKDEDSLICEVKRGLLITGTWYTRFDNEENGDFSTVPRNLAIYIEEGEPKFAIKQL